MPDHRSLASLLAMLFTFVPARADDGSSGVRLEVRATMRCGFSDGMPVGVVRLWTAPPTLSGDGSFEGPEDTCLGRETRHAFGPDEPSSAVARDLQLEVVFRDVPRASDLWVSVEARDDSEPCPWFAPALQRVAPIHAGVDESWITLALDAAGAVRVGAGAPKTHDLEILRSAGIPYWDWTERGPDGAAWVEPLPAGDVEIRVLSREAGRAAIHDLTARVVRGEATPVALPPPDRVVLSGTLRTAEGAPMSGRLFVRSASDAWPIEWQAIPIGPDGRFEVGGSGLDGARVPLLVLPEPIERFEAIAVPDVALPRRELELRAEVRPTPLVSCVLDVRSSSLPPLFDVQITAARGGVAWLREGSRHPTCIGSIVPELRLVPQGRVELWSWLPAAGYFAAGSRTLGEEDQGETLGFPVHKVPGEVHLRIADDLPDPLYVAIAPVGAELAPRDPALDRPSGYRLWSRPDVHLRGLPCDRRFALIVFDRAQRVVWRRDLRMTPWEPTQRWIVRGGR